MKGEWFDLTPIAALTAICINVRSGLTHFLGADPLLLKQAMLDCRLIDAENLLEQIRSMPRASIN